MEIKLKVEFTLGGGSYVSGRIRENDLVIVGHGRIDKPDYNKLHDWYTQICSSAADNGGEIREFERELSRRNPDRDNGLLKDNELGFYGGWQVDFADILVATWSAIGGLAGIISFLKLLKEIKSLWPANKEIKITLHDGTKIEVANKKDLDVAIETIKRLEDRNKNAK